MSDGQTVTILFYNPDSTPSKLLPNDMLTSWKWILNSRDVTAVLQPETGKDVNIPTLASRIMQLVEKNHNRFVRNKAKLEKENAKLADLTETVTQKENIIAELDKEIAEWQTKVDELLKNPVVKEESNDNSETAQESEQNEAMAQNEQATDEPIVLTGNEFREFDLTNKEGIAQLREVATSHLETMRDEWVDVPALAGKEESIAVQLRRKGIEHIRSYSPNPEKLLLLKNIKRLLKTAKYLDQDVNTKKSQKPSVEKYYYLYNDFVWQDQARKFVVVIEKDGQGLLHFDLLFGKYAKRHFELAQKKLQALSSSNKKPVALPHDENPWNTTGSDSNDNQTDSLSQEFFADDDVMLDSTGSKMVLNLFIFDENGNEIDDLVQDEPQPVENPQNNDIATQDEFLATAKSLGFDDVRKEVYPTNDGELMQFMIDQHFDEFTHQKDGKMYGYAEVTLYTEFTNDKVISRMIDDGEVWRIENNPIKGLQDFKAYIDNIKAELTKQMNEPSETDPNLSYLTDMANGKIELTVQNMKEHILKLKEIAIALDGKHDDLLNQAIEVYQQFALSVKVQ